jgi:mono/diheme cytochrome c family protein
MPSRLRVWIGLMTVILATLAWFQSAPTSAAATLADEGADPANSGWLATFRSADGKHTDIRRDRFVALYVPVKSAAAPGIPPGRFSVTWEGYLNLEFKGEHFLTATGKGKLRVTVNGAETLAAEGDLSKARGKLLEFKRGDNAIVVRYESPAEGDAEVQLRWASEEFRPEPIPLKQVSHKPTAALETAQNLRKGRELAATRRCFACHQADVAQWVKEGGMPELETDTPSLADIGSRLTPGWMARWLQDPVALRPIATMPRPFPDAAKGIDAELDPRARDLAAYLATLGKASDAGKAPTDEAIEAGQRLFHRLGCISCHLAPARDNFEDEHGRIPLRDVGAKYAPTALEAFLLQPDKHYSWIRMPNFQLSVAEAAHLAAYLRSVKPREAFPEKLEGANVANGKKLAESAGCVQCHIVGDRKATLPHAKAAKWEVLKGHECKGVEFRLADDEQVALKALLAGDRTAMRRDTPVEFATRQLVAMRCGSCHKRDGAEDLWTKLKEENDALVADLEPTEDDKSAKWSTEQNRPPLTWVGEKLKPEWTTAILAGKLDYKPRPFLKARMPAFPRRSALLAHGLAAEHGVAPVSPSEPKVNEKLADVGQILSAKSKWGCVGCHQVGSKEAVGVFEAPGVNFNLVRERLRGEYFQRWLWAPQRVEPGTKMPTSFQWGKKALLDDILDGDAQRQIDSLWHYVQRGKAIKPPVE